jgi:hypothetical protein
MIQAMIQANTPEPNKSLSSLPATDAGGWA